MDLLRGFAILLMYWDHWLWINDKGLLEGRLITRLAEPLFALLLGYFLVGRTQESLKRRFGQLLLAALLSNIFFYQLTGHFDILASFIVVYVLRILNLPLYWLGMIGVFLNAFPISWFDYGPGLVIWQAALGMALREKKALPLMAIGLLALPFQPGGDLLALIFTYLALPLVKLAEIFPDLKLPVLNFMGKHPLEFYVVQFPVLWAMKTGLL